MIERPPSSKFLSQRVLERVLHQLKASRSRSAYTAAVLMLNLGLRVSEATSIRLEGIAPAARSIRIRTLKRRRETWHTHEVPKIVAGVVIRARDRALAAGSPWLLFDPRKPSSAVSPRSIQRAVANAAANAGLARDKVTPHTFRHSRAMLLYRASGDPRLVSHDLRHADPRSADQYVHVDLDRYEEAIRRVPSII